MSKIRVWFMAAVCALCAAPAVPHDIEEVQVIATVGGAKPEETAFPITVLDGEALAAAAPTLGATLDGTPGLASAGYGPGVGRPVIRGQAAPRVVVLENGLPAQDVARLSPDHGDAASAFFADRIEVIRGPAGLLYGNGAGAVDVIEDLSSPVERFGGRLWFAGGSNADARRAALRLSAPLGAAVGARFAALGLRQDDTAVPGAAERFPEDPEHVVRGRLPNTDLAQTAWRAALNGAAGKGRWAAAYGGQRRDYGLPPGVHAHSHHEGTEGAADHAEDEAALRIELEQRLWRLQGEQELAGPFELLDWRLAGGRYRHVEQEDGLPGTVFRRDGREGRFALRHARGMVGLQLSLADFAASGEEAFIEPVEERAEGLFALHRLHRGRFIGEFAARLGAQRLRPLGGACARRDRMAGASAALIRPLADGGRVHLGLTRAERAPVSEERYSNIELSDCRPAADPERWRLHAATGQIEIGDPDLGVETATHLELGFERRVGQWRLAANLYRSRVADYIHPQVGDTFEDRPVARYRQADARFSGWEFELHRGIDLGDRRLEFGLFGDGVRGRFADGAPVPRLPPRRFGLEGAWLAALWQARLGLVHAADQDRLAPGETPTPGYTRVDLLLDRHWRIGDREWQVYLEVENLSDEEIRHHTSPLKDRVPEPGRNVTLGLNLDF